jgi:putative membrane protein insertion efficiency factor
MKTILLWLLAGYKRWVSPQLPPACRFTPSCSDYAAEAVTRHGALGGSLLALWRLLRCHPLGGRGLDPVPVEFGLCGCHRTELCEDSKAHVLAVAGRARAGK